MTLMHIDSAQQFGLWADCWYETTGTRVCGPTGYGYNVTVYNGDRVSSVSIGSSWTRGLAIHPVATGITLLALLFSFSTRVTFILLASLASFLSATLALIAFAVDIALYAYVRHEMGKLSGVKESTDTSPAFWMTFVSFLLLCFAGCTICLGRRRDRMAGAMSYTMPSSKGSWRTRFRKA
ncbi:hypothetical protein AcW1_002048 [Taiwanofungus camphoratus]|nr:hypothetical protein AcW1_002048 [Antrodia cinnamomea]KAI0945949.1 hypothetical protein AcV7_010054 [Antrodia cinnamomea]